MQLCVNTYCSPNREQKWLGIKGAVLVASEAFQRMGEGYAEPLFDLFLMLEDLECGIPNGIWPDVRFANRPPDTSLEWMARAYLAAAVEVRIRMPGSSTVLKECDVVVRKANELLRPHGLDLETVFPGRRVTDKEKERNSAKQEHVDATAEPFADRLKKYRERFQAGDFSDRIRHAYTGLLNIIEQTQRTLDAGGDITPSLDRLYEKLMTVAIRRIVHCFAGLPKNSRC
jgi:hypothetical protein